MLGKGGIASNVQPVPESPPPLNPPEAGSRHNAAAVPAPQTRSLRLGKDEETWRELVNRAGASNAALGIHLGRVHPLGVDTDGALTSPVNPARTGMGLLKKPNRKAGSVSSGRGFQRAVGISLGKESPPIVELLPRSEDKTAEKTEARDRQRKVAKDPSIATVLDEFRGAIVEIHDSTETLE